MDDSPTEFDYERSANARAEFPFTGYLIAWDRNRYSDLYDFPPDYRVWDGAPPEVNALVGSRFGGYSYVEVRVTGRTRVRVPSFDGPAVKARIRWPIASRTLDRDYDGMGEWADAWLVARGRLIDIEDAKARFNR